MSDTLPIEFRIQLHVCCVIRARDAVDGLNRTSTWDRKPADVVPTYYNFGSEFS